MSRFFPRWSCWAGTDSQVILTSEMYTSKSGNYLEYAHSCPDAMRKNGIVERKGERPKSLADNDVRVFARHRSVRANVIRSSSSIRAIVQLVGV